MRVAETGKQMAHASFTSLRSLDFENSCYIKAFFKKEFLSNFTSPRRFTALSFP